jgi:hypothetical protein
MKEWQRREMLPGYPGGAAETKEFQERIADRAKSPIYHIAVTPPSDAEMKQAIQACLQYEK